MADLVTYAQRFAEPGMWWIDREKDALRIGYVLRLNVGWTPLCRTCTALNHSTRLGATRRSARHQLVEHFEASHG
jgi:hypothetical protein